MLEPLLRAREAQDGVEELLEGVGHLLVDVAQHGLLHDRREEVGVGGEQVVERGGGGELGGQLQRGALDHLEHEVVLQVVHKVHHLVAQHVASVHCGVAVEVVEQP